MANHAGYAFLAIAACILTSCDRDVAGVHPTEQFVMPQGADPQPEVRLLTMGSLDAKLNVLAGVDGAGAGEERKWTTDKIRFRFQLSSFAGRDFYMQYSVHDVTFRQTGPVRITIALNGATFDSFVKTAPDDYEYKHAADQIALPPNQPFEVTLTIDPPYIAPDDGARLGILLTTIGFVDRASEPARP